MRRNSRGSRARYFFCSAIERHRFRWGIDHAQDGEPTQTSDLDFLDRKYYACSTFSLVGLGNPVFIFAGAETEELASDTPLDHIAWQMVEIPQNP